jgi:hypothetical protein
MQQNAIFGGNWNNGSNAGSRASNWNNYPWNSNNNIGSRFVCDDKFLASILLRHIEQTITYCGQIGYPASANTLLGPVKRLVEIFEYRFWHFSHA